MINTFQLKVSIYNQKPIRSSTKPTVLCPQHNSCLFQSYRHLKWPTSFFRRSLNFLVSFPTASWEIIPDGEKSRKNRWALPTIIIIGTPLWARFYSPCIRLLVNSDGEPHLPFGRFEISSKHLSLYYDIYIIH
jgi:hypothetical protein